jgi:hypothetical protein
MITLLTHISWLGIVLGTVAYFAVGFLWYSPVLFGNLWAELKGMKQGDMKPPSAAFFIVPFVLHFVAAFSLALFMAGLGVHGVLGGLRVGAYAGLGFVLTTVGIGAVFNQTPLKLVLIDGLYHVAGLAVTGIVLGIFQ